MTRPSSLSLQLSKSKGHPGKSTTSLASRASAVGISGKRLKTPIRRLLFKFEMLKPNSSDVRTKRARVADSKGSLPHEDGSILDPAFDSPPPSSDVVSSPGSDVDTPSDDRLIEHTRASAQNRTPSVPCMALQNSDHSMDAVVISTLLKLPFCCHEDLLTMGESRIIEVAQEMNERLPEALRIDLNRSRGVDMIRRDVEVLVGIVKASRAPIPGAPLKTRSRRHLDRVTDPGFILDGLDFKTISPPTSPLTLAATRRTKRRDGAANTAMVLSPTKLAMLQEEDEGEQGGMCGGLSLGVETPQIGTTGDDSEEEFFRATKKRKMSASEESVEMITPTMRRVKAPLMLKKLYDRMNNASPTAHRALRSYSEQKIMAGGTLTSSVVEGNGKVIVKTSVIDQSLAHTRARYRSSSRFTHVQNAPQIGRERHGPLQTSTPKNARRVRENQPFPSYASVSTTGSPRKCHQLGRDPFSYWGVSAGNISRDRRERRDGKFIISDTSDLTTLTNCTL